MAQILKLRRSAIAGAVPTTASLQLGEIALNTYDGKVYMKRSGSEGEEIVEVGSASGSFSGLFSGSFSGSFSGTYTGSFAGDGSGLNNISSSGIVDLNLFEIVTGSVTASVGPNDILFLVSSGSFIPLYLTKDGLHISGSITATQGITGSLHGTASWAINAINSITSSYSLTASYVDAGYY